MENATERSLEKRSWPKLYWGFFLLAIGTGFYGHVLGHGWMHIIGVLIIGIGAILLAEEFEKV